MKKYLSIGGGNMNFKNVEESSIFYLENIGFKENDHVAILTSDGSVLHGFLKFNRISSSSFPILLETHNKDIIDLYTIVGIVHVNLEVSQSHLYNIKGNYRVIFKELCLDNNLDGFTPKEIFKQFSKIKPNLNCNMHIDLSCNTIRFFYSKTPLKI